MRIRITKPPAADTQNLSLSKHVLTASFNGDADYASAKYPGAHPDAHGRFEAECVSLADVPSTVQPGTADLTGTYSGMANSAYLYVLAKPVGNATWTVQEVPLVYAKGTYADQVSFDTHGSNNSQQFELLAVITPNVLHPGQGITTLPQTFAQDRQTTAVQ